MTRIDWSSGHWTNPPLHADAAGADLAVTAVEGSDAWRQTSYGFVHDTEHALLAPFADETAMEVEFTAAFESQFDQAGLFVRVSEDHWIKAGVEFTDGRLQLGAVVTQGCSDWSVAPVDAWLDTPVRIRVSRSGNALTVRARGAGASLQLVRVIPFDIALDAVAGPFVCAPTRAGLTVTFTDWRRTSADGTLHP